jgi:hypothetical protein
MQGEAPSFLPKSWSELHLEGDWAWWMQRLEPYGRTLNSRDMKVDQNHRLHNLGSLHKHPMKSPYTPYGHPSRTLGETHQEHLWTGLSTNMTNCPLDLIDHPKLHRLFHHHGLSHLGTSSLVFLDRLMNYDGLSSKPILVFLMLK